MFCDWKLGYIISVSLFLISDCYAVAFTRFETYNLSNTSERTIHNITSFSNVAASGITGNELRRRENVLHKCLFHELPPCTQLSTHNGKGHVTTLNPSTSKELSSYSKYKKILSRILSEFLAGSSQCRQRETCGKSNTFYETFPNKTCYCDVLCSTLNDCCKDFNPIISLPFKQQQFSCIAYVGLDNVYGNNVYMVTSCLDNWKHDIIKSLCENADDNLFLRTPVTDKSKYTITYKNMYCAQCNLAYDYEYWTTELQCKNNKTNFSDCVISYRAPANNSLRFCEKNIISHCNTSVNDITKKNCLDGPFSVVYTNNSVYKNMYCAQCEGIQEKEMYCQQSKDKTDAPPFGSMISPPTNTMKQFYSFRLLVDLNSDVISKNCKNNEMYDSFSQTCRQIHCAPPFVPSKGACIQTDTKTLYSNSSLKGQDNCTLVQLESSEYKLINDSNIFLLSKQIVVTDDDFLVIGMTMYICSDILDHCGTDCKTDHSYFYNALLESYVSFIGLSFSIIFLTVTFLIYICTPQLLNIHGKNLVCLVGALLLANLLFVLSSQAEGVQVLCKLIAILLHFLYLSSFCWMNVIAFDFCSTFSRKLIIAERGRNLKRFFIYSMYAWCTPLVIVLVSFSLDFTDYGSANSSFKPGYGNEKCWITSSKGLLVFFVVPLGLFKLFDFIAFALTIAYISQARRQGAKASQKNDICACLINLKLSVIMGVTWIFAFIANVSKSKPIWYMFIVFNSLQGTYIAICFLCSKTVWRKVRAKFKGASTTITNTAT